MTFPIPKFPSTVSVDSFLVRRMLVMDAAILRKKLKLTRANTTTNVKTNVVRNNHFILTFRSLTLFIDNRIVTG